MRSLLVTISCLVRLTQQIPINLDGESDDDIFEDIMEFSEVSKMRSLDTKMWPYGRVPYVIDENVGMYDVEKVHYQDIKTAVDYINNLTCVTWIPRKNEKDYVVFNQPKFGCSSHVGHRGGEQSIFLSAYCYRKFGVILHEMLHTLGFHHEQSRPDRDEYVDIFWENIKSGYERAFNVYPVPGLHVLPYDYDSVMHYHSRAFSKTGFTIFPKSGKSKRIGQRTHLSYLDVERVNNLYNDCEMNI